MMKRTSLDSCHTVPSQNSLSRYPRLHQLSWQHPYQRRPPPPRTFSNSVSLRLGEDSTSIVLILKYSTWHVPKINKGIMYEYVSYEYCKSRPSTPYCTGVGVRSTVPATRTTSPYSIGAIFLWCDPPVHVPFPHLHSAQRKSENACCSLPFAKTFVTPCLFLLSAPTLQDHVDAECGFARCEIFQNSAWRSCSSAPSKKPACGRPLVQQCRFRPFPSLNNRCVE